MLVPPRSIGAAHTGVALATADADLIGAAGEHCASVACIILLIKDDHGTDSQVRRARERDLGGAFRIASGPARDVARLSRPVRVAIDKADVPASGTAAVSRWYTSED